MRLRALATAVALAALLSGCGGSSSSTTSSTSGSGTSASSTSTASPYASLPNGEAAKFSDTIVDDAITAASGATSVHIVGSVLNAGKPLKLDLNLVNGKGGAGTVTVNGLAFNMIRIGTKAYFKGGAAFWSHFGGSKLGTQLNGRWNEASATTGDLAAFTPLTDLKELFTSVLGTHGPLEKAINQLKINGEPAIPLVDSGSNNTLFIAADGPPYPLKLAEKDGHSVTFDRWNQPVALQAPTNAVELDKLKPS
jgi:hypothetical protein